MTVAHFEPEDVMYREALHTSLGELCHKAFGDAVQVRLRVVPAELPPDDDPVFKLTVQNKLVGLPTVIFEGTWSLCVRFIRGQPATP